MLHVPDRYRILWGPFHSSPSDKNNGVFILPPISPDKMELTVICSDGSGWEHVSVSTAKRCPYWEEMQHVKHIFWGAQETVMQLHPPDSQYINIHPYCLHMWRPIYGSVPLPPWWAIGAKVKPQGR
jgi:hypothetical protein